VVPAVSPPSSTVIPAAAAAVAAAAVGSAGPVIEHQGSGVFASIPPSPPSLPQRPPSVHSSSESEPGIIPPNPFAPTSSYMSTQEWINNTSSSGSTPSTPTLRSENGSVVGEVVDIPDIESDFGSNSDGEFDEAASWTEVSSQTSENDH